MVIGHGATPLQPLAEPGPLRTAAFAAESMCNGVAAVMVFFIVSGLCIHLPYVNKPSVPLGSFLVRRYLRVGLPLLVIVSIARAVGAEASEALDGVTWSVYAELLYYSLYPALFQAKRRWGWTPLIALTSVGSIAIAAAFSNDLRLSGLGCWAALWGLPIWISGCALAERLREGKGFAAPLWAWRAAAFAASVAAEWLIYHAPVKIGYPFTMLAFAPLAWGWLAKELGSGRRALVWLECLGAASYSLYLVHPVILAALEPLSPSLSPGTDLVVRVAAIAAAAAAFHWLIESPAHKWARAASRLGAVSMPQRHLAGRTPAASRGLG